MAARYHEDLGSVIATIFSFSDTPISMIGTLIRVINAPHDSHQDLTSIINTLSGRAIMIRQQPHLTKFIHLLVSESQLSYKIVNVSFTITHQNITLTVWWGG